MLVVSDPKPSFSKTYRRVDGEEIVDYGWVTDLEYFEDAETPTELVEETWVRTSVRTFWHVPTSLFSCEVGECDEDAVAWEQEQGGEWRQVCEEHRTEVAA